MRNRVTPLGDIVSVPLRGAWLGNRGILHESTDVVRFHRSALWIICTLSYKDWRLPQWQPHHFTVLFFHDEAVALAAGHRPCALCRRRDYNVFRAAWVSALGEPTPKAWEMDRRLHSERIFRRTRRRRFHPVPWPSVPDGCFVRIDGEPSLVHGDAVLRWTTQGYARPRTRPRTGTVEMITPPATAAVVRAGYRPQIDPAVDT